MTPQVRLLFEGTVGPLLELGPCQDGLRKAKEDEAHWEDWLKGGPASVEAWRREMHKAEVEATIAKVALLSAQIDGMVAGRADVVAALAELEGPIIIEEEGGIVGVPLGRGTGSIFDFCEENEDPASVVLNFVGSYSALCGVGAAAPSLRAKVLSWLPRLSLNDFGSAATTGLLEACRSSLQHLSLQIPPAKAMGCAQTVTALNLPQRLESFRFCFKEGFSKLPQGLEQQFTAALFSVNWPQLRVLEVADVSFFLEAVTAKPGLTFPSLHALAAPRLSGGVARALLALLSRGAFPSLHALTPTLFGAPDTAVGFGSIEDVQRQCAVLERLPATASLRFTGARWGPLVELILDGRLASLT
jgi:hypothetical protein